MNSVELIQKLDTLIKPSHELGQCLEEALNNILESGSDSVEPVNSFREIDCDFPNIESLKSFPWWRFIRRILSHLLELKKKFLTSSEKDKLLSPSQHKTVKAAVELVISLGVLPNLSEGIGISVQQRSSKHEFICQNITFEQQCICLAFVTEELLVLYEEDTFQSIILNNYFCDLLSSLFKLVLFDLKVQDSPLAAKRIFLKDKLSSLIENTNQSAVIRELMILNGNKDCPNKLSRALRGLLSERLMNESGVIATLKAIFDIAGDPESPKHWHTVSVLARLIITPHRPDITSYFLKISPQVLDLLTSSEQMYMQVSVMCIRSLFEKEPSLCEKYFLTDLLKPLMEPTSEEQFSKCIDRLYNCFAIPHSELWALPHEILKPLTRSIFRLHFTVKNSIFHLKSKVEDLMWSLITGISEEEFQAVFEISVFSDSDSEKFCYMFGESGGIILGEGKDPIPVEASGDCFLALILKRDVDGKIKTLFFKTLILIISEEDQYLELRATTAKLLSVLCSESVVNYSIIEDPSYIIKFVRVLLEKKLDPCLFDSEIMCLGLMVLSFILTDQKFSKSRNWKEFECLVEPLKSLKKDEENEELRILAEEIYCLILTHGIVNRDVLNPPKKGTDGNTSSTNLDRKFGELKLPQKEKSNCSKAIEESCDALLPVRGHGMRELAKLILSGDKEANAKKETILCIFKENLKETDSYIYLSAIEGMASMASACPEDVLLTLVEQFVHCEDVELRLKVGEVLLRVSRILGEMVFLYKAELLNALLHGCRDKDPMVRASSLSNLGEICKILTFRIGVLAVEIFECIRSIFEFDPAPEPRRAAVMVLTLIIKGLGSDALSVLEPVLVELYRKLRLLYQCEKDEVTKLQAQLALEELNLITVSFLNPEPQFTKRIYVLDPPP